MWFSFIYAPHPTQFKNFIVGEKYVFDILVDFREKFVRGKPFPLKSHSCLVGFLNGLPVALCDKFICNSKIRENATSFINNLLQKCRYHRLKMS